MKIIYEDLKKGIAKIRVETLDDLWSLSGIIDLNDFVEGETYRKIRIGGSEESSDVVKKKMFLKIRVEKIEFSKHTSILRISGVIVQGPEDISRGSHHTFNIEEGTVIRIEKEKWLKFQIEKLKEASVDTPTKTLLCLFDREDCIIARIKKHGYDIVASLQGQVQKKHVEQQEKNFYTEIAKIIEDYDKKDGYNHIILASPHFFKDYLIKEIKNDALIKKIAFATSSSVSTSGINEVLKRPELKEVLSKERAAREINFVEKLLTAISKDDSLAVYGLEQVKKAAGMGAVAELLVTDKLIQKKREDNTFSLLEKIMRLVESQKGEVHIINSEHDGGKTLDGLGGLGGILRYRIDY